MWQVFLFPTDKRTYDINDLKPGQQVMMELYPEIYSCIGCNARTKACTQDLNVGCSILLMHREANWRNVQKSP